MEIIKKEERPDVSESKFNQDIYSKAVRAGKRTYFFDVKSTRQDEYYLTITESKRKFEDDGHPVFEKHKIFLYREDFEKFMDSLKEIYDFIEQNQPLSENNDIGKLESGFVDIEFEDLAIK
jgi:hypothetical protein